jgi:uncharacterized protein DUF6599
MLCAASLTLGHPPSEDVEKLLPRTIGAFDQIQGVRPLTVLSSQGVLTPDRVNPGFIGAEAEYRSNKGIALLLEIVQFTNDGDAYSLFTIAAKTLADSTAGERLIWGTDVGTASVSSMQQLVFFKGATFVRISALKPASGNIEERNNLARLVAEKTDRGEGEIPPLVKHLPDFENSRKRAIYLARFKSLPILAPSDEVLKVIVSEGDADAVIASYDPMRLLIIEFNTPQRSVENDQRIVARIQELWKLGQPAPSAYKRVGNYSVFVFDAPNDQAAKELIDQVHYEQVVSWLGENPNILKEAQKHYVQTTLGVLVAVLKASGFALIACLGTGGLIGALLFTRRRAQQQDVHAFSDAGGMLRLNLDEMTPQTDPSRLLGPSSSN